MAMVHKSSLEAGHLPSVSFNFLQRSNVVEKPKEAVCMTSLIYSESSACFIRYCFWSSQVYLEKSRLNWLFSVEQYP